MTNTAEHNGYRPAPVWREFALTAPGIDYGAAQTLYSTWFYDNGKYAFGSDNDKGTLTDYINKTVAATAQEATSNIMSNYLLYKIGYNEDGKNYGMCMSVLNKCQDYTYEGTNASNREYDPDNNVVKEYLQRTLTKIKVAQDAVISDYAENCITDVSSCLASNNYDKSNNIAINACRAQIRTCMSVNGDTTKDPDPTQMNIWVANMLNAPDADKRKVACTSTGGTYEISANDVGTCTCDSTSGRVLTQATGYCECPANKPVWNETDKKCEEKKEETQEGEG